MVGNATLDAVGGFNERMSGWGFDDKTTCTTGVQLVQVKTLPPVRSGHPAAIVRVGGRLGQPIKEFARHQALAALHFSAEQSHGGRGMSLGVTSIATSIGWHGPPSDSVWCADQAQIPQLPSVDRLAAASSHVLERVAGIPDAALEQLPLCCFPRLFWSVEGALVIGVLVHDPSVVVASGCDLGMPGQWSSASMMGSWLRRGWRRWRAVIVALFRAQHRINAALRP